MLSCTMPLKHVIWKWPAIWEIRELLWIEYFSRTTFLAWRLLPFWTGLNYGFQVVPLTAAVIVTTPQKLAFIDVAKGVRMFSKLKVSILLSSIFCNSYQTYLLIQNKLVHTSTSSFIVAGTNMLNYSHCLFVTCVLFFVFDPLGSMCCCSWEYVPLWCRWKTVLSIW